MFTQGSSMAAEAAGFLGAGAGLAHRPVLFQNGVSCLQSYRLSSLEWARYSASPLLRLLVLVAIGDPSANRSHSDPLAAVAEEEDDEEVVLWTEPELVLLLPSVVACFPP